MVRAARKLRLAGDPVIPATGGRTNQTWNGNQQARRRSKRRELRERDQGIDALRRRSIVRTGTDAAAVHRAQEQREATARRRRQARERPAAHGWPAETARMEEEGGKRRTAA